MVSYFGSGEHHQLLHFSTHTPFSQIVLRRPLSQSDSCGLHLGTHFQTHGYFGGIFEYCSTPSAPSGQLLLRQIETWNKWKCVVLSQDLLLLRWLLFLSYKCPTAPHGEEALPLSREHYWWMGTVLCNLPAWRLLIGSGSTSSTQPYFAVTILNVSRHWWSLLEWGRGRVPLDWSHCCSTTIWCSPLSEHDQG